MSAVLTPNFQDEQILFTPNEGEIAREATRYLFNPADLITERRKFDFKGKDRDAGGEECTSPCLWRTRKFLRRGRITPLEIGPEWHTKDELDESSREQAVRAGRIQRDPNNGRITFYGVNVYPGDEIQALVGSDDTNGGFSRGVTELTPLIGRDWKHNSEVFGDSAMWNLQRFLFPDYPLLPPTLNGLQNLIVRAGDKATSPTKLTDDEKELVEVFALADLETIASEGSSGCDNFRLWGTNFVEMENQRIQARVSVAGFVHTYTDMANVIMKQLEIEPLTIAQHKQKAEQASAAEIGKEVAKALKEPQENAFTLQSLKAAIAEDPEAFRALFAEPKNKGGRPKKVVEE